MNRSIEPQGPLETALVSPRAGQPDSADELLIEDAFAASTAPGIEVRPIQKVFAVVPEEVIEGSPEEFSLFLDAVFADEKDLEEIVESSLEPVANPSRVAQSLRAVVPAAALRTGCDPAEFIEQVFEAFEEIEKVLTPLMLRASNVPSLLDEHPTAVVPEDTVADPEVLIQAIDRAQDERQRFELLFRQAKHSLKRLAPYRLVQSSRGALISQMRKANNQSALQQVVGFLRSVHSAAVTFEKLELPRYHIKEYLEYLYLMEDWNAMAQLVRQLELTTVRYCPKDPQVERGGHGVLG